MSERGTTSWRDELASALFWLAARLERQVAEAVVRYDARKWPGSHMGKSAVTTKRKDAA